MGQNASHCPHTIPTYSSMPTANPGCSSQSATDAAGVVRYCQCARAADRTAIVLVSGRARGHDLSLLRQLGVQRFVDKGPDLGRGLAAAVLAVRARGQEK